MNEPQLQTQAAPGESLWEKAPGWRNLTMAASLLTLAAVATAALLPQEQPMPAPSAPLETVSATPSATLSPLPAPVHAAAPLRAPVQTASLPSHAPAQAACSLALSTQTQPMGAGVVTGFESPMQAQQRVRANEQSLGGPIAPAYAMTPRLIVRMDGSDANAPGQIVVVPAGLGVQIGDRIAFNAIHRDPTMACAYVPPLVTADLGPARPAQMTPLEAAEAAHESASP